jgi:glycine betaine/proline transport system substrate-binding protein
MTKRHINLPMGVCVTLTALAMVTAGCSGSSGSSGSSASDGSDGGDGDKTITMGVIPGWTDETGTTGLLQDVLEDNGYTVEVKEISDNAPMYTALSNGDIDILSSSWKDKTHKTFWDRFGDDLEDIGVYYAGATSFLAVPTYSDITSIEELPSHADEFGGQIVGIEPGAGLTEMTQKSVIPEYGLDSDFKLLTSSTAAMLTELKKATEAEEPIVVTMWKPFWANSAFPIRPLEDPKGAYGEPEDLHVIAHAGFSEEFPEVAEMLANFKLDDEQYNTLEDLVANKYGAGKETEAAEEWLAANPDYAPALEQYLK